MLDDLRIIEEYLKDQKRPDLALVIEAVIFFLECEISSDEDIDLSEEEGSANKEKIEVVEKDGFLSLK